MDRQKSTDGASGVGGMGFAVGYAPGKGVFRVYLCLVAAVALVCGWFVAGSEIVLALAFFFALTGYYFYPLIESNKVRLGAGEHGVFIEGFGIIPWRSIDGISLSTYAVRSIEIDELNIKLSRALPNALIADWRSLPYHRLLMKLPWSMSRDNVVRINLEPFRGSPAEIHAGLTRLRSFYGK